MVVWIGIGVFHRTPNGWYAFHDEERDDFKSCVAEFVPINKRMGGKEGKEHNPLETKKVRIPKSQTTSPGTNLKWW
jgi:hypothetical protein